MTAILYPDCQAVSPNGKYTLEARSPHNGTINHRDGRAPSDDEFAFKYREHQSDFCYRLFENIRSPQLAQLYGTAGGRVLWERWQNNGEDSPHEVVVSDGGWSILRTHGFKPEVIAVSRQGEDVIRVRIRGPNDEGAEEYHEEEEASDKKPQGRNVHVWRAAHVAFSTAGIYWTEHSWRYFFKVSSADYFAWRASWGQRLVIDLSNAALLGEEEQKDAGIDRAMSDAETVGPGTLLSELASQATEIQELLARRRDDSGSEMQNPLLGKLRDATAAIHLAGVHRAVPCVSHLRRLEEVDCASYSTGSTAMDYGWWLEVQHLRPILHHTLRLLGIEPQGRAAYHFTKDGERFPVLEHVRERRQRSATLNLSMDAEQVLRLIGSPDHVRKESHEAGKFYRWTEDWEYDFLVEGEWVTLRITWEEKNRKGQIAHFEEVPAYWIQSDQRVAEILQF